MKSIRRHLTFRLLLWLSILFLIAIVAFVMEARKSLVADFDRNLSPELANARLLLRPGPLGFNNPENRGIEVYIQAWDSDTRNTLYKSANLGRRSLPFQRVRPRMTSNFDAELEDGEPVRVAATGVLTFASQDDDSLGNLVIVAVARNRSALEARIHRLLFLASLFGGIGTLIAAAIARFALDRGIRPLERLGHRVDEIDPGSLRTRLETDELPEELTPFALRINDLLDRIESGFERERRFSADLSHELRTPIAEIRTTAEFASLYPDRASPEDYQSILETTERLQRIVETQLALARIETSTEAVEREPVELRSLLRDLIESCRAEAEAGDLTLQLDALGEKTVETHREFLLTILTNLLSNAVAYCPEGETIVLHLPESDGGEWFRISNPAPRLSEEDLDHLFDRLWRKEAARSDSSHAGLGLSLALSCARALGLDLTAELSDGILSMTLSEIP